MASEAVEIPVSLRDADPAERAGLLVGDVLLDADDETPDGLESLLEAIVRAGDTVSLRVLRGGNISVVDVDLKSTGRAA